MLFEDIINTCVFGLQRLVTREVLTTAVETENEQYSYAVAVVAHELWTVGLVPRKIATLCR